MTDVAKIADYAAQQSDRWLFIAALVVLLGFGFFVWRWIVADRDKLGKRLTEITDKHIESTAQLATVVANNTNALTNNTTALQEVKEVMRGCRAKAS